MMKLLHFFDTCVSKTNDSDAVLMMSHYLIEKS